MLTLPKRFNQSCFDLATGFRDKIAIVNNKRDCYLKNIIV